MYKRLLCLMVIAAFTAPVWADDALAPTWRGDPQSIMQQWTFSTSGFGRGPAPTWEPLGPPEVSTGNPGPLSCNLEAVALFDGSWNEYDAVYIPAMQGRTGVWDCGAMGILAENFDDGKPFKDIRLQVTYYTGDGDPGPEGIEIWAEIDEAPWEVGFGDDLGTPGWEWYGYWDETAEGMVWLPGPPGTSLTHVADIDAGGGWTTSVWDMTIVPNPLGEWFDFGAWWSIEEGDTGQVSVHMYVDQVVIDTISYPEPATVALLGLGSLALIRRKRK